jgi:hypothetical protein
MKESAPESAGDALALLFPELPPDVRAQLVREWVREDVGPAYVRCGITPPAWVEQGGGMDPDEFRFVRYAERIRSVGSTEGELRVLRAAVISRSEATSREKIRKDIGVSAVTLHHFRRGRVPNRDTLVKFERWYREAVIAGALELTSEAGAVLVLKPWLLALPSGERGAAAAELICGMRRWHLTRGLPVPEWVDAEIRWSRRGS